MYTGLKDLDSPAKQDHIGGRDDDELMKTLGS